MVSGSAEVLPGCGSARVLPGAALMLPVLLPDVTSEAGEEAVLFGSAAESVLLGSAVVSPRVCMSLPDLPPGGALAVDEEAALFGSVVVLPRDCVALPDLPPGGALGLDEEAVRCAESWGLVLLGFFWGCAGLPDLVLVVLPCAFADCSWIGVGSGITAASTS